MSASSGCGYLFGDDGLFPSRADDYLNAKESPPLDMPEHIDYQVGDDLYAIPELQFANVLPQKYEVPRVLPLDEVDSKGSVKVQTFKGNQWVLAQRAPSQAWPLVIQFLRSNDIPLTQSDAEKGLLQTDWLSVSVDGKRLPDERYRFTLSPGVQANTTEVLVKHQAATIKDGIRSGLSDWQASSSEERQNNMVTLLAEFLAGSPEQSSHSLLAQGIGSASRVSMQYFESGMPYLALDMPFDRGWASLGLALPKSGFVTEDRDRRLGLYYVKADFDAKKEKDRNWLSKAIRSAIKDDEQNELDNYQFLVVQKADQLQISVSRQAQPELQANEQAFLLRRILIRLT